MPRLFHGVIKEVGKLYFLGDTPKREYVIECQTDHHETMKCDTYHQLARITKFKVGDLVEVEYRFKTQTRDGKRYGYNNAHRIDFFTIDL